MNNFCFINNLPYIDIDIINMIKQLYIIKAVLLIEPPDIKYLHNRNEEIINHCLFKKFGICQYPYLYTTISHIGNVNLFAIYYNYGTEKFVYTEINCKYIESFDKNIHYKKRPMDRWGKVDKIKERGYYKVSDGRLICFL